MQKDCRNISKGKRFFILVPCYPSLHIHSLLKCHWPIQSFEHYLGHLLQQCSPSTPLCNLNPLHPLRPLHSSTPSTPLHPLHPATSVPVCTPFPSLYPTAPLYTLHSSLHHVLLCNLHSFCTLCTFATPLHPMQPCTPPCSLNSWHSAPHAPKPQQSVRQ